jgi:hypothetical protein
MKEQPSTPFDSQPDLVLGAALRAALEPGGGDQAAFVARVMAGADRAQTHAWDLLARWARTGIAAATLAAALTGLVIVRATRPVSPPEEALAAASGAPTALLTSPRAPDASVLLSQPEER